MTDSKHKNQTNNPQDLERFDLLLNDDLIEALGDATAELEPVDSLVELWNAPEELEHEEDNELEASGIPLEPERNADLLREVTSAKQAIANFESRCSGLMTSGSPEELVTDLEQVGYYCPPFLAAQLALCLSTESEHVRALLLEGPPGCGKSFLAHCLGKLSKAELIVVNCFPGMDLRYLIEQPRLGPGGIEELQLGVLARAFKRSQSQPVIILIDEIDKTEQAIDTFLLGPLQDGIIRLEDGVEIEANRQNLLVLLAKNFERELGDALLRRVAPVTLPYLDSTIEQKVLKARCLPRLIDNLTALAETMRTSDGSYRFARPPAPDELISIGRYVMQLLDWDILDMSFVGRNVWNLIAKSEDDRRVLDLLLRYHPDFTERSGEHGRLLTEEQVEARLGRLVLRGIISPNDSGPPRGYEAEQIGLTKIGAPGELTRKLAEVNYHCLPYLALQVSLLLNSPSEGVRALLLEGPPGCGKSFLAKSLAKVTGAELMCLSCYAGMNTQHLIEQPSSLGIASAMASKKALRREELVNLGILSRAFLKSQSQPVILLIDEIDKVERAIDTFFLGPIQDGTIYPESRAPIDANTDNLLLIFTKNFERELNDALLRRVHPVTMTFLNAELEQRILSEHCNPILIANLVALVDRMRHSEGTYGFDRPPAPEELLTIGHYINNLLTWAINDFEVVGRSIWNILCKSSHDRAVLEHMLRFHPDFLDPLIVDGKALTPNQIFTKLGRTVLKGVVADPEADQRQAAWARLDNGD